MKLTEIDLKGYGHFLKGAASFEVSEFFLPEPWDYIYTNRKILLRIRHNGTGYAQLDPPGGTVLHKMERFQEFPSLFVWLKPEGRAAFSNFFKPHFDVNHPSKEPGRYTCTFTPSKAVFHLRQSGLDVVTEMTVPADDPAVLMRVTVKNTAKARRVDIIPVWRPHNTSSSLAPWDVPEVYQTCQYCNDPHQIIWIETRNPGGVARLRRRAFIMTDMKADTAEVYYDRFAGQGSFALPQAVLAGRLGIDGSKKWRYLGKDLANTALAQLPIAAFHKGVSLGKGESYTFTLVLAGLPEVPSGAMPPYSQIARYESYLAADAVAKVEADNGAQYTQYETVRSIKTPDEAFNRYVNEWLPLQLRWVTMLDRGWPTGLRGTRDAAQDFTGLIPFYPQESRRVLFDIFACQRTDGWFPRQYSTDGPEGKHDLRPYVDAGCWVWEFLYDYIRYTGDMDVLNEKVRWLDRKDASSVLEHAQAIFAYYMNAENIGEHGLAKIREGDWLDSVNAAGLAGRGESVMVSCQVVLAARQAAELFGRAGIGAEKYGAFGAKMRESLRSHALNSEGYLNGVFTDGGQWVCSPKDPDGRRRIHSPANSFGVIAGVFEKAELPRLFEDMKSLKQDNGYALFKPGIGDIPINNLGRIGQGDMLPGVGENGNPYNHGSHGFFGRAAAAAGQGDLLWDIFKYMLPYDQQAHPIEVSKTAPYGVVNHWASIEGQFGKGGATFLSGSITTAVRNVYGGMMGFRPTLDGIEFDPCLPSAWERVQYHHNFRDASFDVTIENPGHVCSGVKHVILNGSKVSGNTVPLAAIARGANRVKVILG
jgi:N,N'-diacetylchitobiose phosphorylase